jgi:hypothetical protein
MHRRGLEGLAAGRADPWFGGWFSVSQHVTHYFHTAADIVQ